MENKKLQKQYEDMLKKAPSIVQNLSKDNTTNSILYGVFMAGYVASQRDTLTMLKE